MLNVSDKFLSDIQGKTLNIVPLVIIDTIEPIYVSTQNFQFDNIFYKPLLLNIPSFSESLDFESRKYRISSVSITLSNNKYKGEKLYNNKDLINKSVHIYYKSQSCQNLNDCLKCYIGKIRNITFSDDKLNLSLEDLSQETLHRDLPVAKMPDSEDVVEKHRNTPIPMVYGKVLGSPTKSKYSVLEDEILNNVSVTKFDIIIDSKLLRKNLIDGYFTEKSGENILLNKSGLFIEKDNQRFYVIKDESNLGLGDSGKVIYTENDSLNVPVLSFHPTFEESNYSPLQLNVSANVSLPLNNAAAGFLPLRFLQFFNSLSLKKTIQYGQDVYAEGLNYIENPSNFVDGNNNTFASQLQIYDQSDARVMYLLDLQALPISLAEIPDGFVDDNDDLIYPFNRNGGILAENLLKYKFVIRNVDEDLYNDNTNYPQLFNFRILFDGSQYAIPQVGYPEGHDPVEFEDGVTLDSFRFLNPAPDIDLSRGFSGNGTLRDITHHNFSIQIDSIGTPTMTIPRVDFYNIGVVRNFLIDSFYNEDFFVDVEGREDINYTELAFNRSISNRQQVENFEYINVNSFNDDDTNPDFYANISNIPEFGSDFNLMQIYQYDPNEGLYCLRVDIPEYIQTQNNTIWIPILFRNNMYYDLANNPELVSSVKYRFEINYLSAYYENFNSLHHGDFNLAQNEGQYKIENCQLFGDLSLIGVPNLLTSNTQAQEWTSLEIPVYQSFNFGSPNNIVNSVLIPIDVNLSQPRTVLIRNLEIYIDPTYLVNYAEYEPDILGCTDPLADNYNPDANLDDNSCVYETDPTINYKVYLNNPQLESYVNVGNLGWYEINSNNLQTVDDQGIVVENQFPNKVQLFFDFVDSVDAYGNSLGLSYDNIINNIEYLGSENGLRLSDYNIDFVILTDSNNTQDNPRPGLMFSQKNASFYFSDQYGQNFDTMSLNLFATDQFGNTSEKSIPITINDQIDPNIYVPDIDEDVAIGISPNGTSLLQNPADVILHIIKEEIGSNVSYNPDKVQFARNAHKFRNFYNINQQEFNTWKLAFTQSKNINSKKLIEEIARNTKLFPRFSFDGQDFEFTFKSLKDIYSITRDVNVVLDKKDIIKYTFSKSELEQVYSRVKVFYNKNYKTDEYSGNTGWLKLSDIISDWSDEDQQNYMRYYGFQEEVYNSFDDSFTGGQELQFNCDFIRDENTAKAFRYYLLGWYKEQHNIVELELPLSFLQLEPGDVISLENLLENNLIQGEDYSRNYVLNGLGTPDGEEVNQYYLKRNKQVIYPLWFVTNVRKSTSTVKIKAIQIHDWTLSLPDVRGGMQEMVNLSFDINNNAGYKYGANRDMDETRIGKLGLTKFTFTNTSDVQNVLSVDYTIPDNVDYTIVEQDSNSMSIIVNSVDSSYPHDIPITMNIQYESNNTINTAQLDSNILLYIAGDVNKDGTIDIGDIITVVNYILNAEEFDADDMYLGDMQEQGALDVGDLITLVGIILDG